MTGRQRNDDDVSTTCSDFSRSDNRVGCVVTAFHDHIRLKQSNELERCVLLKQRNGIDHCQGSKDVHPLSTGSDRPGGALEPLHRVIAVDADDERVTVSSRANEHIDVPRMEKVEHAIGENDATLLPLTPVHERLPRHRFSLRGERTQYVHSVWGEKRMSRTISGISTRS
jgi:hypothetical protein